MPIFTADIKKMEKRDVKSLIKILEG